jgi:site-specific DNA-adenine methylase
MHYLGGKSRLAKRIVQAIIDDGPLTSVCDPFCGGLAMSMEFARRGIVAYASDALPGLGNAHADIALGLVRLKPKNASEERYLQAKREDDTSSLGMSLRVGMSFGGKLDGGYTRAPQEDALKYIRQFNLNADKCVAVADFLRINRRAMDYREACAFADDDGVYYFDPPYQDTTGYSGVGKFDHARFWAFCRGLAQTRRVYVSEFQAPEFCKPILQITRKTDVTRRAGQRTDKPSRTRVDTLYKVMT